MCQSWCYWLVPTTPRNIRAPGKVVAGHHTLKTFQHRVHRGRREEKRKTRVCATTLLGNPTWFFSVASVLSAISVLSLFGRCASLPVSTATPNRKSLFFFHMGGREIRGASGLRAPGRLFPDRALSRSDPRPYPNPCRCSCPSRRS